MLLKSEDVATPLREKRRQLGYDARTVGAVKGKTNHAISRPTASLVKAAGWHLPATEEFRVILPVSQV